MHILILSELLIAFLIIFLCVFFNVNLLASCFLFLSFLAVLTLIHGFTFTLAVVSAVAMAISIFFNVPVLRRQVITLKFFLRIKRKLPRISSTEKEVLNAGDIWWEQELFRGRPDWSTFKSFPLSKLSAEEQAFLDNQVETLCVLLEDWNMILTGDLPASAWDYIKKEKFLGLAIPKKYGGLGFSALAHSTIIQKIASRTYSGAVDIMVPNSVGLAEFILNYGTETQKSTHLTKFVRGEEIPCFALTAPEAGSDASAMPDSGVICWGHYEGQKTLGVKLNWDKRYITLAPIATMIGLAFKLYDPDLLIGDEQNLGITLAMIPRETEGVKVGSRHCPLFMAFLNGPVRGENVFIPLDYIIGGPEASGKGWSMLMECLSVGRGISLPALCAAVAKVSYRMTSAYVNIREQFHTPIGNFEGIKEALARIGAFTYLSEATRWLTASAIDHGLKPSIATAITKYHLTEMARKIINHAMDAHGGRLIQLGPKNYLGLYYIAQPISITVEGANILTRNLIIFGQGALRCHPFVRQEVEALEEPDQKVAIRRFDRLLFKHIGYILSNSLRCFLYGLTNGRWIRSPVSDYTAKYYRQITRLSTALALVTDMAMGIMGGKLKQRERLSARLGDVLSYLYLACATLKYYQENQKPVSDLPFVDWILNDCLYQIANAFELFFVNFPHRSFARLVKNLIFPWGNPYHLPLDQQDHHIADVMMQSNELRERLTANTFKGEQGSVTRKMDEAFKMLQTNVSYKKLQEALREGKIHGSTLHDQIIAAKNANILLDDDVKELQRLDQLRFDLIQVDEFSLYGDHEYGRQNDEGSLLSRWQQDPLS